MKESKILKIDDENVLLEFEVDGEIFVAVEGYADLDENTNVLFFKKDSLDDNYDCIVSIDEQVKLDKVIKKFEEIVESEADL